MGLLTKLKGKHRLPSLPSGSFTVDRDGALITSTVPSRFSEEYLRDIATVVLRCFVEAREAGVNVSELQLSMNAMSIRAVEMRGGAMISLSPRGELSNRIQPSR